MKEKTLICLLLVAAIVIVVCYASRRCSFKCSLSSETFSVTDEQKGKHALEMLEHMILNGHRVPEISKDMLDKFVDHIYLVKLPSEDTKENMEYSSTQNTRYWPYYYYSFPYNVKSGGVWPPGMYSRLNFWSPGFYTGSGWSYYMRPGIGEKYWARNRWVRNTRDGKNTYYYLSNRGDYVHDAANYSDLPLRFHA